MFDSQRLGELLIEKGLVTKEQLEKIFLKKERSNLKLSDELIRSGLATEKRIIEVLAEALNLNFSTISDNEINPQIIEKVPARFVTHYNFMPLNEEGDYLNIAINDPFDLYNIDEIKLMLKRPIKISLATSADITEAIKKYYGVGAKTIAQMVDNSQNLQIISKGEKEPENKLSEETEDPSVINFVNQLIRQAIKERATDIHLEPYEGNLRLRYRIDGLLYDVSVPATIHHFQSAIISRIKIMADLNIAEKRLPQDGRIKVRMENEDFDLRISILPTNFGECVEIRILSRKQIFFDLEQLGLDDFSLSLLDETIKRPHGILLVTGPTGSGKTTTLYTCLNKINLAEKKIITIEDPVEYQLQGITQIQVHPKINLTFANGLRSMLRHDPDIMMVGEIRDLETAELAIRTALTGHLVFSTLHTNDAAGAVTRLLDMGIEPYLVSSSLNCCIAQRLIRLICPYCKTESALHQELLAKFSAQKEKTQKIRFYKGKGCEKCKYTGYLGRTGIFEILIFTDAIKEMVLSRCPSNVIKQKAVSLKMKTLRQSGWEKIAAGITTAEEVIRVTQEDITEE